MSDTIKLTLIPITKKQPEYGVEVLLHNENEKWFSYGHRSHTNSEGDHYYTLVSDETTAGVKNIHPTHFAYLNEK